MNGVSTWEIRTFLKVEKSHEIAECAQKDDNDKFFVKSKRGEKANSSASLSVFKRTKGP